MADQQKVDTGKPDQQTAGDGAAEDTQGTADQGTGEEQQGDDDKGSDDGGKGDDPDADGDGDDQKDLKDLDGEPAVRKSATSFIIQRKNKKIEKLQKGGQGAEGKTDDAGADDDKGGDTQEISAEVSKAMQPALDMLASQVDEGELTTHLSAHPEHKRYAAIAQKYIEHEAYRGVPISFIFYALAGRAATIAGKTAAAKQNADKKQTGGGGRAAADNDGELPDIWNMSDAEFQKLQFAVKTGKHK